jgi:c-di-GMP-related signal transduction protein
LRFRGDAVHAGTEAYSNFLETVVNFGLEKPSELKKLTGKLTAFVRCPVEALNEQLAQVLPASLTVLKIVQGPDVSPELLAACRQMKALGFRIALDDFRIDEQTGSLVELANYIEIDFARTNCTIVKSLLSPNASTPMRIIGRHGK